jgi:hypothetical protein
MLKLLYYKTATEVFCVQASCNSKISSNEDDRYILYIATLCLHREGYCDTPWWWLKTMAETCSSVFHYNKTNQMNQFPIFIPAWNSTCFGQFLCPSSGVYSLYTRHCYMSYRFVDSFRAGPGLVLVILYSWLSGMQKHMLLESCLQTCMTCNSAECTLNKLLMMGRGTARNM